jgi:hypothetical protein
LTSIREIKILKSLSHPNIVSLREVSVGKSPDNIFLVFEYCEHDFAGLLARTSAAPCFALDCDAYTRNVPPATTTPSAAIPILRTPLAVQRRVMVSSSLR